MSGGTGRAARLRPVPHRHGQQSGDRPWKCKASASCGAIVYQAEVDPETVAICHCTDCQRLSGGIFRVNMPAPAEHFRIVKGEPRRYVKTADSGARRVQRSASTAARRCIRARSRIRKPIRCAWARWTSAMNWAARCGRSGPAAASAGCPLHGLAGVDGQP